MSKLHQFLREASIQFIISFFLIGRFVCSSQKSFEGIIQLTLIELCQSSIYELVGFILAFRLLEFTIFVLQADKFHS